jgi:hypothetical protein
MRRVQYQLHGQAPITGVSHAATRQWVYNLNRIPTHTAHQITGGIRFQLHRQALIIKSSKLAVQRGANLILHL